MAEPVSREEIQLVRQESADEGKLRGCVAVVTGASPGGIGFATAKALALQGASVILAGRKERREEV